MPKCRLFLVILHLKYTRYSTFCNLGFTSLVMKKLRKSINIILWTLVTIYFAIIVMLKLPPIQRSIGGWVSHVVSEKINTNVEVGNVDLGFLNRIIIDDVKIYDQRDSLMLASTRLSAKLDILEAIKGKVSISSAQLFGFRAYLSKDSANAPFNFQFVLDSLASKNSEEPSKININIGSLIIRNGLICYDQKDHPKEHGKFSAKHIKVSDISSHIILNKITQDSINLHVKSLSLKEESGLAISLLSFKAVATKNSASVSDFELKLPNSHVFLGDTKAKYRINEGKLVMSSLDFSTSINKSYISPADLASFSPDLRVISRPIDIALKANGHGENINIKDLVVKDQGGGMSIFASGYIYDMPLLKDWRTDIKYLRINQNYIERLAKVMKGEDITLPDVIERIGDFGYVGSVSSRNSKISANGKLTSNVGNVAINCSYGNNILGANINTDGIDIGKLLADERLGNIATKIELEGKFEKGKATYLKLNGNVNRFFFNGYTYRDIEINGSMMANVFNGKLKIDDPNASLTAEGELAKDHISGFMLNVNHLNPNVLGLTDKWKNTTFSGKLKGDFHGNSLDNAVGNLNLHDFRMSTSPDSVFVLNNVNLICNGSANNRNLKLSGDFGHVILDGQYRVSELPYTLSRIVASRLPSIPGLSKRASAKNIDKFSIDAILYDASILRQFMNIPLETQQPLIIKGDVNQIQDYVNVTLVAPDIKYSDSSYKNINVRLFGDKDKPLEANLSIDKVMADGEVMSFGFVSSAINDRMVSSIEWDNHGEKTFSGSLNTEASFAEDETGKAYADVNVLPSLIFVGDTVWNVANANINFSNSHLNVNNFSVSHDNQHIIINGKATRSSTDSITINLHDVNAKYVLDMVNFHSVGFDGYVSGKAVLSSLFSQPEIHGDITVRNFIFETGHMGTLKAYVNYDNKTKQININARADDGPLCQTLIGGYVSPARKELDLKIKAIGTSAEFMEGLCSSFLDNVRASVHGDLRLFGPLNAINIEGDVNVDGEAKLPALNTVYTMLNCPITLRPNIIILRADTVADRDGNTAVLNGVINHHNLSRWTYDIGIKANNLLSYDFQDFGDNTFFGKVYATGTCDIRGKSGEIIFDIDITPQRGTFFEYNAAAPETISNTDFIEWTNHAADINEDNDQNKMQKSNGNFRSDMKMNFRINATPDAAIKLLMDKTTGDMITLYGNGNLRAIYHNKQGLNMYGKYEISHGKYDMTIQNVIKKDFTFKSGGSIVFGGNPYNAILNMKAIYTVNGVSLSDLHIGRSFSNNNVRVDCIMNITGTPNAPHLDFDFDMPTVNEDAKQMARSIINSEEELNQQVIYLLSIGRFYSQENSNSINAQQSQTSLAMQSLLSGTITQQINTVLSNVINNSNWNFGANISTGDEGFNNAEYEGILSGRLLNNRLQINGQFGYRDNNNATTSFIGDFDINYLLFPNGNLAIRVYNQTNDRYFTRNSLTTQGVGLIMKKDFTTLNDLFGIRRKKGKKK